MKIIRDVRRVAGASRSLRYDVAGRRVVDGGVSAPPVDRPPRPALAATLIGALGLAGATGACLAVVNGLSALASGAPPPRDPLPVVAESVPPDDQTSPPGAPPMPGAPPTTTATAPPSEARYRLPAASPAPGTPARRPPEPPYIPRLCVTPPVPTPTSPPPPTGSVPPTPTAAESPSPSG